MPRSLCALARSLSPAAGAVLALSAAPAAVPDDPLVQRAYAKASDGEAEDNLGFATALSGSTLVAGALGEDGTGVNHGAVYVFVRGPSGWTEQQRLQASNPDDFDVFGSSVAVDGDTIVVGAPGEDSGAAGVNGDQLDDGALNAGAAYVYVREGGVWVQQAYLKASNPAAFDSFGEAVGIAGDTIVVGAPFASASSAGAAYVFERAGGIWAQTAELDASNADPDDRFGDPVAISGETIAVGARNEQSAATGVNGDEEDDSITAGAAYVFVHEKEGWRQHAYVKASNTEHGDGFASALALSQDTLVVTAQYEDSAATGVNGSQANGALGSGAAYVFVRSGETWSQEAYVKASNTQPQDWFGTSVAIAGDRMIVGAYQEDAGSPGVNGDEGDNSIDRAGAAYFFERGPSGWEQVAYLKASNPGINDQFGFAAAVGGDHVAVAARFEDGPATTVNGVQGDGAPRAGAVYVYEDPSFPLLASEVVRLGDPPNPSALQPGQSSAPVLGAVWDPAIDHATFVPDSLSDFLLITGAPIELPLGTPGTLLCDPTTPLFVLETSAAPGLPFLVPIPNQPSLVGLPACAQGGSIDATLSAHLTNALDVVVGNH